MGRPVHLRSSATLANAEKPQSCFVIPDTRAQGAGRRGLHAFALPPAARLRDGWQCHMNVTTTFDASFIPVTHVNMSMADNPSHYDDAHFYYYARGCSDLHVHTRRTLVAPTFAHARLLLALMEDGLQSHAQLATVYKHLRRRKWTMPVLCGTRTPAQAMRAWLRVNPCQVTQRTTQSDDAIICWLRPSSSPIVPRMHPALSLKLLMKRRQIDTVVALYQLEGPGQRKQHWPLEGVGAEVQTQNGSTALLLRALWKTEVFRLQGAGAETFYDARLQPCRQRSRGCFWCGSTELTQRACMVPRNAWQNLGSNLASMRQRWLMGTARNSGASLIQWPAPPA